MERELSLYEWQPDVTSHRCHLKRIVPAVSIKLLRLIGCALLGYRDRISSALPNCCSQKGGLLAGSTYSFLEESTLQCCLILQQKSHTARRNRTCSCDNIDNLADTIHVPRCDLDGAHGSISDQIGSLG